eukprot:TCALIF_12069-PA protein Name:"Protein of unknown function" AED:0.35 eAED:0.35 QI:0/1/0/1/1/1/2/0/330
MVVNESVTSLDRRNDRQLLVPVSQIPTEIKRFFEHKKAKLIQKVHGTGSLDPEDLRTITWLIEIALVIFMICAICAILFLLFMCVHQIWDNYQRDQARKSRLMALKQQAYFHQTHPEEELGRHPHRAQPYEEARQQLSSGSFDSFSDEAQLPRIHSGNPGVRSHQPLFKKCSYNPSLKSASAPQATQTMSPPPLPPPGSIPTSGPSSSSSSFSEHFQKEIQINVASPPLGPSTSNSNGMAASYLSVMNPNENDRSFSVYEEMPPPPPPLTMTMTQSQMRRMDEYLVNSDPPTLRALQPLPYDCKASSSSDDLDDLDPDYQRVAHVKATPF